MKLKLPGSRFVKWIGLVVLVLAALGGSAYAFFVLSPWPSVYLLKRDLPDNNADAMNKTAEPHIPADIVAKPDIAYGEADDETLDVYLPPGSDAEGTALPAVVWLHGDAFILGNKADVAGYLKVLAGRGYATVSVAYTLAPGAQYPAPVLQANAALAYIKANAATLRIDPKRIVLAGDSAGAQLAAQLAAATTDTAYAAALGIQPAIEPASLKGIVLFCGIYDPSRLKFDGDYGHFLRTALWAYLGTKDFAGEPRLSQFAVNKHVSAQFPPSFVSAGNGDPLEPQSRLMAEAIEKQGVRVEKLFFPDHYDPKVGHGYQFDLSTGAARAAFNELTEFLAGIAR